MSEHEQEIGARVLDEIVGNIPDDLFRVIERGPLSLYDPRNASVRPCDHQKYVLDDEHLTVLCAECKEKLEPYAVLRRYAQWCEHLKHVRDNARYERFRAIGQRIRNLLDRSCFTEEERQDIGRRTHLYGNDSLEEIEQLQREVQERVTTDKHARAKKRVDKENTPRRPKLA